MDVLICEEQILREFDRLCVGMVKTWMTKHNFTRTADIWDDAMQCARLGFLLYLRKYEITRAEDVFKDGTSPYWLMYKELCNGLIMGVCAPCGIRRTTKTTKLKFGSVSLDDIENDAHYSTASSEAVAVDEMTVAECLADLRDDERQIALMRLEGIKPGEIQRRLAMTSPEYQWKMKRIKKRLRAE